MKRAINKREAKGSTYAFVVDGDCERWYIELMKTHERQFAPRVSPELRQPKSLKEQYALVLDLASSYDYVVWIIDLDVVVRETIECKKGNEKPIELLKSYLRKIEAKNKKNKDTKIITIVNNPCFEFWLFLHFKQTTTYYSTCDTLITELKKTKELTDYKKSEKYYKKRDSDLYLKLQPFLNTAIRHSQYTHERFLIDNYNTGVSQMCKLFDLPELRIEDNGVGH